MGSESLGYLAKGGMNMNVNTEYLTHASICLDAALEQAESGNPETAREYIRKCIESLEMV